MSVGKTTLLLFTVIIAKSPDKETKVELCAIEAVIGQTIAL